MLICYAFIHLTILTFGKYLLNNFCVSHYFGLRDNQQTTWQKENLCSNGMHILVGKTT